jgi:hypothetical protein
MNNISFENNTLWINDKTISFKYNIDTVIENDNSLFIMIDIPLNQKEYYYEDFHNVYCYDANGDLLWQIGERSIGDIYEYVLIVINDNNLYATDMMGRRYLVNKKNGMPTDMKVVM